MRPHLFSFELAWASAAFDAVYPEPGPASSLRSQLPHGVASMQPARFFDGVLAKAPFEQFLGLRVTLWMIALAPLFTIGHVGTIASIGRDDRSRVVEGLLTSSSYVVRQLAMSFKAVATLLFAQSSAVRVATSKPRGSHVRSSSPLVVHAERLTRGKTATRAADESASIDVGDPSGESHEHAAE